MAEPRRMTSRGLSVLPILLMGATHFSLPPLQSMFELEPLLMYGWYGIAVLIGFVLFRRAGVVKDHEYNRAKAMRKIKHVYEAEARGVWDTNESLEVSIGTMTSANLNRSVSEISGEAPEIELDDENKVEVRMLSEADHIMRANARISGEVSLDDEAVTGTIGASRKISPMDRFLDGLFGLFGFDSRADREAQRLARLRQAASQAPVVAQRPVAPLRFNKSDDESEVNMTSMSDSGGVETVITTSGQETQPGFSAEKSTPSLPQESLESMAMMGQAPSASVQVATKGPRCRGCQAPVGAQERYCPHCGLDI